MHVEISGTAVYSLLFSQLRVTHISGCYTFLNVLYSTGVKGAVLTFAERVMAPISE